MLGSSIVRRSTIRARSESRAPRILGRRFSALYEEGGRLDGYVGYEVVSIDSPGHPPRRLVVHELCALSGDAYVALWDFLLGIDLTVELVAAGRPVDEPIKWLLAEPRQLQCTGSRDRTWVRLVDVARCLALRRYPVPGDVVVGLHDHFCPWNTGRYRIVVNEEWGTAQVARTEAEPDVELDASRLASMYLGGVSALSLADVGQIRQVSAGGSTARGSDVRQRPPALLPHAVLASALPPQSCRQRQLRWIVNSR